MILFFSTYMGCSLLSQYCLSQIPAIIGDCRFCLARRAVSTVTCLRDLQNVVAWRNRFNKLDSNFFMLKKATCFAALLLMAACSSGSVSDDASKDQSSESAGQEQSVVSNSDVEAYEQNETTLSGEQNNNDFVNKLDDEDLVAALREGGHVIYIRHAKTNKDWGDQINPDLDLANCNTQRQLSDEQIRVISDRGGVIGLVFDAWMMHSGWKRGETTPESAKLKLKRIVDHADHICQITGNSSYVGIGSDLDGGYGTEQCPQDIDSIADLQNLEKLMF